MANDAFDALFDAVGKQYNVHPALIKTVFHLESGGNPNVRDSPAGAQGGMQIMPRTAQGLGVDPRKFEQAVDGAARYLREGLDATGTGEGALAYYHGGPNQALWGPKTAAYVAKGVGLFPSMAIKPTTQEATEMSGASILARLMKANAQDGAAPGGQADGATPADGKAILERLMSRGGAASAAEEPAINTPADAATAVPMPSRFQKRGGAPTPIDVGAPLSRIGGAAVQGFQEGSQPLPPLVTPVMEGLGVFDPAGNDTLVQGMNRQVIGPLAQLGEYALRGANGLFRGWQAGVAQAGREGGDAPMFGVLGSPQQLGRDLAAFPDAFMGGGVGMPRNRLAPGMEAEAPYARLAADLERRIAEEAAMRSLPQPEFLPPGVQRPPVQPPAPPVAPEFIPPPSRPAEPAPVAAESAPGKPRSVGAAVSPEGAANITDRENRAYRYESEMSSVLEPQPLGMDTTIYVPGSIPTKAQYSGDPAVSQVEKLLRERNPAAWEPVLRRQNEARLKLYDDLAGSKPQIEMQMQMRDAQAQRNLETAFKNKKDVDASPVVAVIDEILASPRSGESEAVRAYVQPFRDRLFDAKGNLKADPERLYGIREDIAAKINKASKAADPRVANAERELIQVKEALDKIIEQGAPGYQKYLTDYREASKPIEAMELLQEFRPRMVSGKTDEILFTRFDKFMKDLIGDRSEGGISPAKSLPDETVQQLIAIHRDLKRANNIELGEARGSPTNLRGAVASAIGMPMAHAAAGAVLGPMGNAALHAGMKVVEPMLGARRLGRLTDEHLAPPPGR